MVVFRIQSGKIWPVFILFLLGLFVVHSASAQTPGLIFKKSTAPFAPTPPYQVLDPNGDGYVSTNTSGFVGSDVGSSSEIPYRVLPLFGSEPLGDVITGATGGQTDLAQPPWGVYYDGANILCRVRVGSTSTASKGFSIFLDTDNTFATTANTASPTGYNTGNPGFEFELLLATNFSVQLIDHRPVSGAVSQKTLFTGDVNLYSQRSVALTTSGGDTDYFYDYYIPLSAFGGAITASTPLRMSGTTITSAQSGISGTAADVGGVDDRLYGNDPKNIWRNVINSFPPTTLTQLQNGEFCRGTPTAPVLNSSIRITSTSFSGTSTEIGGTVSIYRATSSTATPTEIVASTPVTVASDGTWTFPIPSGVTLAVGDIITARISYPATNSCPAVISAASNSVTVANAPAGACATQAPSSITTQTGSKTVLITTVYAGLTSSNLKVYRDGVFYPGTVTLFSSTSTSYTYEYTPTNCIGSQFAFSYTCGGGGGSAGSYATITATVTLNGCESARSTHQYLSGNSLTTTPGPKTTLTPSISTSFICSSTTTITGTSEANSLIYLYVNGEPANKSANGSIVEAITADASGAWTIDYTRYAYGSGVVLTVKAKAPGATNTYASGYKGLSASSNSVTVGSNCGVASDVPTITGTYCTSTYISSVSGTSSEAAGTTINIYKTGVTSVFANTTVSAGGYWTASIPANQLTPGSTFYATAQAPNENVSSNSTTISVTTKPSGGTITINPVTEGATSISGSISGTVTNPSTIRLYIDGSPVAQTATITGAGTWTVTGIPASEVAAGLRVTATVYAGTTPPTTDCSESEPSAAVVISCTPPITTSPTITLTSANTFCSSGTAQITITNSENGVVYEIYNGSTRSGSSVLGTGSTIILTSGNITSSTTLTVRAYKVGASCGTVTFATSYAITITTPPIVYNVTPATQSICSGNTATVTLSNSQTGVNYQIYINGTASGSQVPGSTGSPIQLTSGILTVTTTSNITLTVQAIPTGACSPVTMNGSSVVTVNPLPTAFTVSLATQSICSGGTATVNLSGSQTGVSYRIYINGLPSGNAVNGTGNAIILTSAGLTANATLSVQATSSTSCSNTMSGTSTVTVNTPPTVFNITPANQTICSGGTVQLTLSGSQSGVKYQIYSGGAVTGTQVTGSGGIINLISGPLSANTTLTVQAIAPAGCTDIAMTGSTAVTVNNPPTTYTLSTSNQTICSGSTATLTLANSQSGVYYQIYNGSNPSGAQVLSSGGAINLISAPLTTSTTLTVQAIAPAGCSNVAMTGSTVVTVNSLPAIFNVTPGSQTICSGNTAQLTLSGSESGVQYQMYNGSTPTGNPVNGTGSSINLISGTLTANATLSVQAIPSGACSPVTMTGTAAVTVITPVVPTISSSPTSFCGSGTTVITVSNPQNGYSYQLFRNGSTTPEVNWGAYSGTGTIDFYVTVNQNASFTVKAATGTCAAVTSSQVLFTVNNCAINYTVSPAYPLNEYVSREVLATPVLPTGTTYSFTGTNFLPGTTVDLRTGKIYVNNLSALVAGTRTATISVKDLGTGVITDLLVTYSVSPTGNPSAAIRSGANEVLPVTLLYFKGVYEAGKVTLSWATVTEKNNHYFAIERSPDGTNFTQIATTEGAGNSASLLTYTYEDLYGVASVIYYRLKQVDFDGKSVYSPVIAISPTSNATVEKVIAYPNPTSKQVRLYIPALPTEKVIIKVVNSVGMLVKTLPTTKLPEGNYIDADLEMLPAGTYIITVQTATKNYLTRVVKY